MNDATLTHFRNLAEAINPGAKNWQWIGQFESQRMFGVTEARAKEYAERFGGVAKEMPPIE